MANRPPQVKEKVGNRYGRLVVTSFAHCANKSSYWNCLCDCGKTKIVSAPCLSKNSTRSCGCLNTGASDILPAGTKNEIGKVYGYLEVLSYSHSKQGTYWNCRCVCGTERIVSAHAFRRGMVKSCGCKSYEKPPRTKLPDNGALYNKMIGTYKRHAHARGYVWELSRENAIELFSGNCHYCDSGLTNFLQNGHGCRDKGLEYNGIDRLDNELGYIDTNTVSCCKYCNSAKREHSVEKFLEWAHRLVAHQNSLNTVSLA